MAGNSYFNGNVPGLQAVADSTKWGNSPGGSAIFKYNDNGADKWWVPNSYSAGNAWSNASLDPTKAQGLGGMAKSFSTSPNTGNPFGQNYNQPGQTYEGYSFNTMPTIGDIEGASNFTPGKGDTNAFMNKSLLALGAGIAGGAMLGPGSGGVSPISGGGMSTLGSAAPGGALATGSGATGTTVGTGMLGSSIPAYTPAMNATGAALGGNASIGGVGAAASRSSGWGSSGIFGDLLGGVKDALGSLSTGQKIGGVLGLGDLALRYNQGQQLKDIAGQAADRGDALKQPERLPYQDLLNDYMINGKPLTDQPMIKANQDIAGRNMMAMMAKGGQTGAGDAPLQYAKYMNENLNSTAMPYLQQLSGNAGFGFGPGYSGNIYGQYSSQATGALPQGLEALARGLTYNNKPIPDYIRNLHNAQQQQYGAGPGSGYVY